MLVSTELNKMVRDYKDLQRLVEEAQNEMEAIRDAIKAEMAERNADELVAGEYKVRYTPCSTTRFDSAGLKTVNPEIYRMFTRTVETRRFSIS